MLSDPSTPCSPSTHSNILWDNRILMLIYIVCVSNQITELSSELADERNTGESASQLLETETSERLRLERDMKDLQVDTHTHIQGHTHTLTQWWLKMWSHIVRSILYPCPPPLLSPFTLFTVWHFWLMIYPEILPVNAQIDGNHAACKWLSS